MGQYAAALRDVGEHVLSEHEGSFEALVEEANGSAVAVADRLAGWGAFADTSEYEDRPVPFFKRAQIAAADLNRLGVAPLAGEERLTAFADNLVPHVLRVDGVLRLDPDLAGRSTPRSCSSTARPRRSSCAPAPSTRSSCSPAPAPSASAPPRSTPPSGTAVPVPTTSPPPALAPATPATEQS